MDYRFFGLTLDNAQEFRYNLFTQIHNIVYHGNGGYDWYSVYNMPIWLRKFTFKQIDDYIKELNKKQEAANRGAKQNILSSSGKIKPPNFSKKTRYK